MKDSKIPDAILLACEQSLLLCIDSSTLGGRTQSDSSARVIIFGLIADVQVLETRRGAMALVKLSAGNAVVSVFVFSDSYPQYQGLLKTGNLISVIGERSIDNSERVVIIAEEVIEISDSFEEIEKLQT